MTVAKEIVRQASPTQCYSKNVEALKREYDQPRLLFAHHINRLLLRAAKDDNNSLGELQRAIEGVVEGLQAAKGYTADQLVCGMITPLLTDLSKQQWRTHIASSVHPPSVDKFLEFIANRSDATRDDRLVDEALSTATSKLLPRRFKQPQPKEKKPIGRALQATNAPGVSCSFCQQGHYTFKCPTLSGQNLDQKWDTVKSKRLCFNCLAPDHSVSSRHSRMSCLECHRKHHTLLRWSIPPTPPVADGAPVHLTTSSSMPAQTAEPMSSSSPLLVTRRGEEIRRPLLV